MIDDLQKQNQQIYDKLRGLDYTPYVSLQAVINTFSLHFNNLLVTPGAQPAGLALSQHALHSAIKAVFKIVADPKNKDECVIWKPKQ